MFEFASMVKLVSFLLIYGTFTIKEVNKRKQGNEAKEKHK